MGLPNLRNATTLGACMAALIAAIVIGFGALGGALGFDELPSGTKRPASGTTEIGSAMSASSGEAPPRATPSAKSTATPAGSPAPATGEDGEPPALVAARPGTDDAPARPSDAPDGSGGESAPSPPEAPPAEPPSPAPSEPAVSEEPPPAEPPAEPAPAGAPTGPIGSSIDVVDQTVAGATALKTNVGAVTAPVTAPLDSLLAGSAGD